MMMSSTSAKVARPAVRQTFNLNAARNFSGNAQIYLNRLNWASCSSLTLP